MSASEVAKPRFAVIGHPIAHSKSPQIHLAYGEQLGLALEYERLASPVPDFEVVVRGFARAGGRGLNVTLPFKERAMRLADTVSERAQLAGAANTLVFSEHGIAADNTDGVGLVTDIQQRWALPLAGAEIFLIGAGGAARGVLLPLLQAGVSSLTIANRTQSKAQSLADMLAQRPEASACRVLAVPFESLSDWTEAAVPGSSRILINATASGLNAERLPLAPALFSNALLAYDMVYAKEPTPFMQQALAGGCVRTADGLGMLVEQAAESFMIWHGQRPLTEPVYQLLRAA